jgi:hypothetical protein
MRRAITIALLLTIAGFVIWNVLKPDEYTLCEGLEKMHCRVMSEK